MKKLLSALLCGSAIVYISSTGCKEIGPAVNLSPAASVGMVDSVSTLSSAQIAALTADPHSVLVEEFTGQSCSNCAPAHTSLDNQVATNPSHINVICLFPYSIPQALPPTGAVHDFRDSASQNIANYVSGNGVGALPSAYIDRVPTSGNVEVDGSGPWSGLINGLLPATDSVNLALQSSYNSTTGLATIIATVTYASPVSTKQNLSVVVVEDTMYDIQEVPVTTTDPTGFENTYLYTCVFRDMVSTAPSGDPVLDTVATKVKGRVLKRTYTYKLKTTTPAINPAHCRVIAYINSTNGADKHILQSAQTKFTP